MTPQITLDWLNALPGWSGAMRLHYTVATPEEVTCEFVAEDRHLQPFGLVHGGVHCGVIETVCSIGATLAVREQGMQAVGLENTTSFVRATKAGARLVATGKPVVVGRTNQLWEAWVRDERGRVVAQGRVRLANVASP